MQKHLSYKLPLSTVDTLDLKTTFGSESTALKILYKMMELDNKIETTDIRDKKLLVESLSMALEIAFDYKEAYSDKTDTYKELSRESVAKVLLACANLQKTTTSKLEVKIQVNAFFADSTEILSKATKTTTGLAYNVSNQKIFKNDDYRTRQINYSLSFPEVFKNPDFLQKRISEAKQKISQNIESALNSKMGTPKIT